MKLRCDVIANWPPLAWVAHFSRGGDQIHLRHGPGVHTEEDWFNDAVWDGPFAEVNFDQTDHVFGAVGRERDSSTFQRYELFLAESMRGIGENLSDHQRTWTLEPIASISTGYDLHTAATVAR